MSYALDCTPQCSPPPSLHLRGTTNIHRSQLREPCFWPWLSSRAKLFAGNTGTCSACFSLNQEREADLSWGQWQDFGAAEVWDAFEAGEGEVRPCSCPAPETPNAARPAAAEKLLSAFLQKHLLQHINVWANTFPWLVWWSFSTDLYLVCSLTY